MISLREEPHEFVNSQHQDQGLRLPTTATSWLAPPPLGTARASATHPQCCDSNVVGCSRCHPPLLMRKQYPQLVIWVWVITNQINGMWTARGIVQDSPITISQGTFV